MDIPRRCAWLFLDYPWELHQFSSLFLEILHIFTFFLPPEFPFPQPHGLFSEIAHCLVFI